MKIVEQFFQQLIFDLETGVIAVSDFNVEADCSFPDSPGGPRLTGKKVVRLEYWDKVGPAKEH